MERFFLLSDPTKKPLWNVDSSIRIAHKVDIEMDRQNSTRWCKTLNLSVIQKRMN